LVTYDINNIYVIKGSFNYNPMLVRCGEAIAQQAHKSRSLNHANQPTEILIFNKLQQMSLLMSKSQWIK
jgi:hypothetical protein